MTMEYPTEIPADAKVVTAHNGETIRYSVDETSPFTINAWNDQTAHPDGLPFWHQPHDMNHEAWPDRETAQAFADEWILHQFINPPAPEVIDTTAETATPPASN